MRKLYFSFEQVNNAVLSSKSTKEFLISLGMKVNNGNYRKAEEICREHGLAVPKASAAATIAKNSFNNKIADVDYFAENVLRNNQNTKARLVKEHGWEDLCSVVECTIGPEWLGKPLTLQLDHIDGDRFNNTIANLRILCGHCHSQTPTFSNSRGIKTYNYCHCGVRISKHSVSCVDHRTVPDVARRTSITFPEADEVIAELRRLGGWSALERELGIGQNTIRKYLKRCGFDPLLIEYTRKTAPKV